MGGLTSPTLAAIGGLREFRRRELQQANSGASPARRMIGSKSPEPSETEAIKRYGWRDQGILVVSADDQRLTWPERELVRQLGSRLYGRTPREDR